MSARALLCRVSSAGRRVALSASAPSLHPAFRVAACRRFSIRGTDHSPADKHQPLGRTSPSTASTSTSPPVSPTAAGSLSGTAPSSAASSPAGELNDHGLPPLVPLVPPVPPPPSPPLNAPSSSRPSSPPSAMPRASTTSDEESDADDAQAPVSSALTATPADRALLNRVLRYALVFIVVSVAFNVALGGGYWDRLWAALVPAKPASIGPPTDEDEEDAALVDHILAERPRWLERQRQLEEAELLQALALLEAQSAQLEAKAAQLEAEVAAAAALAAAQHDDGSPPAPPVQLPGGVEPPRTA